MTFDPLMGEPEERARDARKAPSWSERLMWSWLRNRRLGGYKFRRQHPFGEYVLDFFCEEALLAVEVDGFQHGFPEQQQHDAERTKFLEKCGVKVLRFWNGQLKREREVVRAAIFNALQERAPHPLPEYTRPMPLESERPPPKPERPHPGPLPRGEGNGNAA